MANLNYFQENTNASIKQMQPYYIEAYETHDDRIKVVYCSQYDLDKGRPNWVETSISLIQLEEFIDQEGLRECTEDYVYQGEYVQKSSIYPMDEYLEDHLEETIKMFLETRKENLQ